MPTITRRSIISELRQMTGVHSLERSAQEDTLLVLFNTAISNLVSEYSLDPIRHSSSRSYAESMSWTGSFPK